ncbi:MAG: endonuclease III domain-containing protein [Thermosulfidibacteraceae bacterium]|jgi:endonuclease-3
MKKKIDEVLKTLDKIYSKLKEPYVSQMAEKDKNPFKILVSSLLSLRTKDEVTEEASRRLFKMVKEPMDLLKIPDEELERIIYPVGFYKNKAKTLKEIARTLIEKYDGKVPESLEELLKIKGIGRKTANLVITEAFGKDGICVDTHVHRISNRMGLISTKTPKETEEELKKILPRRYWKNINKYLVAFGKKICTPVSPRCSMCPFEIDCPKVGVTKRR